MATVLVGRSEELAEAIHGAEATASLCFPRHTRKLTGHENDPGVSETPPKRTVFFFLSMEHNNFIFYSGYSIHIVLELNFKLASEVLRNDEREGIPQL